MNTSSSFRDRIKTNSTDDPSDFYYPQTREFAKRSFRQKIISQHPDMERYTVSRAARTKQEFIPFVNERDKIGRLIVDREPVTKIFDPIAS